MVSGAPITQEYADEIGLEAELLEKNFTDEEALRMSQFQMVIIKVCCSQPYSQTNQFGHSLCHSCTTGPQ